MISQTSSHFALKPSMPLSRTMDTARQLVAALALPFRMIYLFTESDIPAAVIPTIMAALILVGPVNIPTFLRGVAWNVLHLATFNIKNQIDGLEEDKIAKPTRPIAAGHISLRTAAMLYPMFLVAMWTTAWFSNTVLCTAVYTLGIFAYNEGGLCSHPVWKSVLGAAGVACYSWGTAIVFDHGKQLEGMRALAIFLTWAIFTTTGHASDFRDLTADAAVGRTTIPMLFSPRLARWSLAALAFAWTCFLTWLWQPPFAVVAVFAAAAVRSMGGFVGNCEKEDEKVDWVAYKWYGAWLLMANILPVFPRLRGEVYY